MQVHSHLDNHHMQCERESSDTVEKSRDVKVVVVGGGVAGLRAAKTLQQKLGYCKDVVVLEACRVCGGRVREAELVYNNRTVDLKSAKQNEGYEKRVLVELGAEVMHGKDTFLTRTADEQGWQRRAVCVWAQGDGGPGAEAVGGGVAAYYDGQTRRWYSYDDEDEDFVKLNSTFEKMSEAPCFENDFRSVDQALRDEGVSSKLLPMGEAGYANTLGTSLSNLSWSEMCTMERFWVDEGEEDSRLDATFQPLISYMQHDLNIVYHSVVTSISHDESGCLVNYFTRDTLDHDASDIDGDNEREFHATDVSGQNSGKESTVGRKLSSIRAEFVIITVSLAMLQQSTIEFFPTLPEETADAIRSLGWAEHTVKFHLLFSKQWWQGRDIHGIIAANCDIPEMWFDRRPNRMGQIISCDVKSENTTDTEELVIVVGFAMDNFAKELCQLNEDKAIQCFLNQLDSMFKVQGHDSNYNHAAPETLFSPSSVYLTGTMTNWANHRYVRGGYSYPKQVGSRLARCQLASPAACGPSERVFFAGEHTGIEHCTTVHSAIETGERAANIIIQKIEECCN